MFDTFRITHPNNLQRNGSIPSLVRVGHFCSQLAEIPALLPLAGVHGLCFDTDASTRKLANRQMEYIALSLLGTMPSEELIVTLVDIGLNTNFPILSSIDLPNVRFVTNRGALKEELERIQEHARYVSTKCLGYNYNDLHEYNDSSDFKEPYNVICIANFPKEFSASEIDIISLLIEEGERCGLVIMMNIDTSFFPESNSYNNSQYAKLFSIYKLSMRLEIKKDIQKLYNADAAVIDLLLNSKSFKFDEYALTEIADVIKSIQHNEPGISENDFLSLPIGRSGKEIVNFEMGKASGVYHGFIAGQSGTGKSTLLNNIITSIAEKYSPNDLRLYLLDYKWGVEFQIYKNHPNVEFLLLDNENLQIGVEVFKRLEKEIINRAKLFRNIDAYINNIDEYNARATTPLPRILIIIDEVQQLFVQYEIRKQVNSLIKEIAKQGRAFGVHMLFSSQSYIDCHIDTDALNQMSLRIAFGLANNSECRAILGVDNYAPTKLQPYTAIYNRKNGDKEYNQLVKMENFDKNLINDILLQSATHFTNVRHFEKTIVEKNDTKESKISEQVVTVQREEYKGRDFMKEFGF